MVQLLTFTAAGPLIYANDSSNNYVSADNGRTGQFIFGTRGPFSPIVVDPANEQRLMMGSLSNGSNSWGVYEFSGQEFSRIHPNPIVPLAIGPSNAVYGRSNIIISGL